MKGTGDGKGEENEEVAAGEAAMFETEEGVGEEMGDAATAPAKELMVEAARTRKLTVSFAVVPVQDVDNAT